MKELVVSANQAAKMLMVSREKIPFLLANEEIEGYYEGRGWKIKVKSLEDYVDRKCKEKRTSEDAQVTS